MRDSSPALAAAFASGVVAQGLGVVRIGLGSTDQLYFAAGQLDCPGAMFTASHNPAAYNGIKLCRAGAKPVGADTGLNAIREDLVNPVAIAVAETAGTIADKDVLGDYGVFLRSLVNTADLRPLRVAVDAGNGMAGHTAPAVLGAIDSVTLLPLYFELDGTFPNHEANPLDRRICWTCRSSWWQPVPTSGWPSTGMPTAASWWTSVGSRSLHRR
ncbi:phosphoglucomutase/phosphomannomutase, alpha/beta/alpha domain I family protein [Mycobacterium ulcerans str. Harvey]|uniref:Phosphoglucomutase/phosphomannomutase, alpha/beta/alpha domain I family protein n=1 Tax=Mycobacterium ulcerans str. Harvey TaxID=1299332 RepID=A0ABP3AQ08_MYCUL|nr:phosphoglucomutase/phosphomannomutase, alpha/beta/alpha domain I family protein [Mycobacterium ulcerans str. Harvey]